MRASLIAFLLCLLYLVTAASPAQTTRNVGSGQPYPTIQSAIDAANPGDTVLIAPGTYFENIDFHGKAITVTSSGGPAVTTLDGSQSAPAVTFSSGETRASVLSGLTVQHGGSPSPSIFALGGIYMRNAAPTILGNTFTQNNCWTIYGTQSGPLIQNNTISATRDLLSQCEFGAGTGIFVAGNLGGSNTTNDGSATVIVGNTIENNIESGFEDAGGNGGAAIAIWGGSPVILNNLLRNNSSPGGTGGAIHIEDGFGVAIVQNLIYGNFAGSNAGALAFQSNPDSRTGIATLIANNTLDNNTASNLDDATESAPAAQIFPDPAGYGESTPANIVVNDIVSGSTAYPAVHCAVFGARGLAHQPAFTYDLLRNTAGPFFDPSCIDVSTESNNITADPQFLNPATFDLHLQPTSPAIAHGDPSVLATFHTLTGLTLATDFDGNPRETTNGSACTIDMGAFQHIAPGATPCGAALTLTAAPNPSTFGQTVTFTAQLSGNTSAPSGDIVFTEGTTTLATVIVSPSGAAIFTTSTLTIGTHTITATWQPTGNTPGTQASVTQVVGGYPTTLFVTPSPNPATAGQPVTFTMVLSSPGGTPIGTVSLADGGNTLTTLPVTSGTATYTTATLAIGTHEIIAVYTPGANFAGDTAIVYEVITGHPTSTSLTATPNPVAAFSPLTLTSTVTAASGTTPTGTVTFTTGGITLGTAPLAAGTATVTLAAPAPGTYPIIATYSGDTAFNTSNSAPITEIVIGVPSTTTLTATPNPAYQGQPVTINATVVTINNHVPIGSLSFFDGPILLGSATLAASGSAAFTIFTLAPGLHSLTATFAASGAFAASTSNTVSEQILPASFAIALSPATLTLHTGQSGTVAVTLTSIGDFTGPLTLTTGPMPTYGAATLNPATITLTTSATATSSLLLTTATAPPPHIAFLSRPGRPLTALAALLALLLPLRRLRRARRQLTSGLTLLFLALTLSTLTGCGANLFYPFNKVAVGAYQLPVTATDPAGNQRTATLTLAITP